MKRSSIFVVAAAALLSLAPPAEAATTCTFTVVGSVMTLNADCTTDAAIIVPDGFTLNGNGFTITAVDPAGGHFKGAVVMNGGATAFVSNLTVEALALANVCDAGANRLRGIMFEGASGSITHVTVKNINQGPSGCQEGNAIEIRKAPFDGTHPDTATVTVSHSTLTGWQKTGIVANGDVFATIVHNTIGASATQANLAANSVQFGFGGGGILQHNHIEGNIWTTNTSWASSAVLVYLAAPVNVSKNNIGGNADVGIWIESNYAVVDNNRVFEDGPDGYYDIGIGSWGTNNLVTNNKVRGYDVPYDGVTGGKNKAVPGKGPQKAAVWF